MLNIHLQVTYFDQHLIGIAYGGLYAGLFGSLFFSFSFFPRFSTSLQGPRSRAGQTRRCSSAPPPAGEKGGRTPLRLFLFLQNPTELAASEITAGTLGEKNSEMPGIVDKLGAPGFFLYVFSHIWLLRYIRSSLHSMILSVFFLFLFSGTFFCFCKLLVVVFLRLKKEKVQRLV